MVEYNPFNSAIVDDVYAVYRQLRDEAPVYYNEEHNFYALSRFDDVMKAHLDPEGFSSGHGTTIEGGRNPGQPYLIAKDPPEHTWHRKIVSRMFTPRAISNMEPFIRKTAADLLDAQMGRDSFDIVADFSWRLPLAVIGELVGLPAELRSEVHERSDEIATRRLATEGSAARLRAGGGLIELLATLVVERRRNPGDDVISILMGTDVEDGNGGTRRMGDAELAARFQELTFAGHETVTKLIANGVVALAWYPDARRELVADPSLMPQAVEEMLRWDPPSQYQGRWTTRDVEIGGETIPDESRVVLLTGSAVHDERKYDNPELFDIHRHIDRHVSFGFGIHLCLGAALARLETRIAFEELLARFPEYEIADEGVVRQYSTNVRGLEHLPIVVDRQRVPA